MIHIGRWLLGAAVLTFIIAAIIFFINYPTALWIIVLVILFSILAYMIGEVIQKELEEWNKKHQ